MRIGAAQSLDVDDLNLEDQYLQLVHQPETGTTLKNGQAGERLVAISAGLVELLEEFKTNKRVEATDEHGREPLLSGQKGRIGKTTMRRTVYRITAPCYLDNECPDCSQDQDAKCGEAVSPHAIRRGSITHYRTNDVPIDVVGDRMNVSRKVLKKHSDQRPDEGKPEQRRRYLDKI